MLNETGEGYWESNLTCVYKGQNPSVPTIGYWVGFVASADLSEPVVYGLTNAFYTAERKIRGTAAGLIEFGIQNAMKWEIYLPMGVRKHIFTRSVSGKLGKTVNNGGFLNFHRLLRLHPARPAFLGNIFTAFVGEWPKGRKGGKINV